MKRNHPFKEPVHRQVADPMHSRCVFTLSAEQFNTFARNLDEPPAPNEKLKRLFSGHAPWET